MYGQDRSHREEECKEISHLQSFGSVKVMSPQIHSRKKARKAYNQGAPLTNHT